MPADVYMPGVAYGPWGSTPMHLSGRQHTTGGWLKALRVEGDWPRLTGRESRDKWSTSLRYPKAPNIPAYARAHGYA